MRRKGSVYNYNERFSLPIHSISSNKGNGYKVDDKNNWLRLKFKIKKKKKIIIIPSYIPAAFFSFLLDFFLFTFFFRPTFDETKQNSLHYFQLISPPPALAAVLFDI